jgi:hypothetical protein
MGPEFGQLVQIVPGCDGKGNRSAVGVGHEERTPHPSKLILFSSRKRVEIDSQFFKEILAKQYSE